MSKENNFETLLAELQATADESETLAKALPPAEEDKDDAEIAAAAAEGGEENPEDAEDDVEGGEAPMTKSMMVGDEEVQVVDADLLVKSLQDIKARVDGHESTLAKGLETALGALKSQGELIKSLQGQIAKLAGQGAGRKTVLTVTEKPAAGEQPLAKSQQDGMTAQEFLAKSHAAFDAKKITGQELTTIDVALRNGQVGVLDQGLIAKVIS